MCNVLALLEHEGFSGRMFDKEIFLLPRQSSTRSIALDFGESSWACNDRALFLACSPSTSQSPSLWTSEQMATELIAFAEFVLAEWAFLDFGAIVADILSLVLFGGC
jgi:hypothetical protein